MSVETSPPELKGRESELGKLELRRKIGVYALCASLLVGMACWVIPRALAWPLNDAFVVLWLVSTALIAAGAAISAWLFAVSASGSSAPWVMQVMGFLVVLWDILFVAFNLGPGDDLQPILHFSKAVIVVPQLLVIAALVLLLVVRWRDVCDRRIWTSTRPGSPAESTGIARVS